MGELKRPAYIINQLTQRKINRLLAEDPWSRAMLAKLRRGIGKQPGELPELFEIVLEDIPVELYSQEGGGPSYAVRAIYTALTLFALHQQGKGFQPMSVGGMVEGKKTGNSLGTAVGYLTVKEPDHKLAIKRRFDAAVTANEFTEFAYHARGLIQLLRAADITLDYPRFAEELYWYQFDEIRNRIRLRWGEDYYRIIQTNTKKENGGISNEQ